MTQSYRTPALLALLVPLALLIGAFSFEYIGGLFPCEMCWWQRIAHMVALPPALVALCTLSQPRYARPLILLAAIAIAVSGGIGLYHAGVEQHWWQGITACAAMPATGGTSAQILAEVMAMPLIRCDTIPWSLLGVSMAGWNAILSLFSAGVITWLTLKKA